jgi:hypothetical protein
MHCRYIGACRMVYAVVERRLVCGSGISFRYNCWTAGERKGERVLTHLVIVSDIHDAFIQY